MTRYDIPVVFDTETDPPMPLGVYVGTDESTIGYEDSRGKISYAPDDCVRVAVAVVKVA